MCCRQTAEHVGHLQAGDGEAFAGLVAPEMDRGAGALDSAIGGEGARPGAAAPGRNAMETRRSLAGTAALAALAIAAAAAAVAAQESRPAARPGRTAIVAAAREVMERARYCALITLGSDGQPQARAIDAFAPEDGLVVWIATRPVTRKVAQIRRDPRVTLYYYDAADPGYVTLIGRAEIVTDPAEKAKRWKQEWASFYRDANRGDDYMLIKVTPLRVEVLSTRLGIINDPVTWEPVGLPLP
jgi:PPOX class probable F420-dependent enzyme